MREWLREKTEVAGEIELPAALGPEGTWLLGDDDALAGGNRTIQERFAGAAASQQVGEQGGFAGLPQAGQQRHVAARNEAGENPICR